MRIRLAHASAKLKDLAGLECRLRVGGEERSARKAGAAMDVSVNGACEKEFIPQQHLGLY